MIQKTNWKGNSEIVVEVMKNFCFSECVKVDGFWCGLENQNLKLFHMKKIYSHRTEHVSRNTSTIFNLQFLFRLLIQRLHQCKQCLVKISAEIISYFSKDLFRSRFQNRVVEFVSFWFRFLNRIARFGSSCFRFLYSTTYSTIKESGSLRFRFLDLIVDLVVRFVFGSFLDDFGISKFSIHPYTFS